MKQLKWEKLKKGLEFKFRLQTSSMRSVPDFIIPGMAKSGTTSLYYYLCHHPGIKAAYEKEVNYFGGARYKLGLSWYRSNFPLKFIKNLKSEILTGEASPDYFFLPQVPERIKYHLPDVKLIFILRNPVDVLYSAYHHNLRLGNETSLSFEEALQAIDARMAKKYPYFRSNKDDLPAFFMQWNYFKRAIYYNQLRRYLNYFHKKQILILCSEKFFHSPASELNKAFRFLEVPDMQLENYPIYKQANPEQKTPMRKETREWLVEFFRPYNEKLFSLIGKRFPWNN